MNATESTSDQHALTPRHVVAAVCAWLLPGLGHWVLGQRQRAALLAVSIGGLWLLGVLIGGIGVVSFRTPNNSGKNLWFIGQALTAPSVGVHFLRKNVIPMATAPGASGYYPSYGRVYEQGVLCTALAGLLNLLAMMDVMYRDPIHYPKPTQPGPSGQRGPPTLR